MMPAILVTRVTTSVHRLHARFQWSLPALTTFRVPSRFSWCEMKSKAHQYDSTSSINPFVQV